MCIPGALCQNLSAADRLTNAPQPGAVPRLTAEQVCQIGWRASNQLTRADWFDIQWSQRDLADEIMRLAEPHKRSISAGELTYVRALERLAPPLPGKVSGNKFEYQCYGMWSFMTNFDVSTGCVVLPV